MNDELQESRTEEPIVATAAPAPPVMSWRRFAYACEFLIALLAVFTVWSEVGGQGHLDLLPWYVKLAGALGMSWGIVRFTAGMAEEEKAWNRTSVLWLSLMISMAFVMLAITYYYHLHEVPDENDSDDTAATSVKTTRPGRTMAPI